MDWLIGFDRWGSRLNSTIIAGVTIDACTSAAIKLVVVDGCATPVAIGLSDAWGRDRNIVQVEARTCLG